VAPLNAWRRPSCCAKKIPCCSMDYFDNSLLSPDLLIFNKSAASD
jgi:hypothetical protein